MGLSIDVIMLFADECTKEIGYISIDFSETIKVQKSTS